MRSGRNRRLPQQRPLRARLPTPSSLVRSLGAALNRSAPAILRISALAAIAGAGGATWVWLTHSPRFALRDVVVEGNRHVSREAILRRAGVAEGKNLLRVSPRHVESALAADPWIEAVEARRRMPDRLEILVTERQPAALVSVEGAGLYLADTSGRLFKRAAVHEGEGDGLVVISGLPRALFSDTDRAAALVSHALHVGGLWSAGARPAAGAIHLGREGVTLRTLEGGVAVVFGRGDDAELAAAMKRFDAIWSALPASERARARRIHLDSFTRPDRVTVSLADTGPPPKAGRE